MEKTKMEIELREYLDDKFESMQKYNESKFSELNCKLNKLEQLRQIEYDTVISACKDISFMQDQIQNMKTTHESCKENCNANQKAFTERVEKIVGPRINHETSKMKVWIVTGVCTVLLACGGYLLDKFVFTPLSQTSVTAKK